MSGATETRALDTPVARRNQRSRVRLLDRPTEGGEL